METKTNDFLGTNPCCTEEGRDMKSLKKCRNKAMRNLFTIGLIFLIAFILGYLMEPAGLRIGWLVITGTIVILCGLMMYLIKTGVCIPNTESN